MIDLGDDFFWPSHVVWGRLHVFPREERDIFIGDTSGGRVIVLLRREGVLGKVVVSYVALLVFGLKKPSSVRSVALGSHGEYGSRGYANSTD